MEWIEENLWAERFTPPAHAGDPITKKGDDCLPIVLAGKERLITPLPANRSMYRFFNAESFKNGTRNQIRVYGKGKTGFEIMRLGSQIYLLPEESLEHIPGQIFGAPAPILRSLLDMQGSGAVEGYRITYGLSGMVILSEKPPSSLGVIYPPSIQCIFEDAVTMLDRFSHLTQDTALEEMEESDCLDYWVTSW